MTATERWRARAITLEAMAWLTLARILIRAVRFRYWRRALGRPCLADSADAAEPHNDIGELRLLARAVERGAARLPGESRCLPLAMALQWLLRRRGLGGVLHLGVRADAKRGGLDDLHAWVACSGEILIGASDRTHLALYSAANPKT